MGLLIPGSVFVGVLLFLVSFLLVYINNILYVLSILFVSSYTLFFLVSNGLLSVLVFILITVVYVGAMMILIGYICAVCPNPILLPRFGYFVVGFTVRVVSWLISPFEFRLLGVSSRKVTFFSDVFFRGWGLVSFVCIVLMLFVTLLMVTSQNSSPQGPFRSVN